jgi:hypothetical protein
LGRTPQSAIYIAIPPLILFIVLTSSLWQPAIFNQLNRWSLLPEPQKLTELYFTQPENLPSTYLPSQNEKISFTVHNLERRTMTYRYIIAEQPQDGSRQQTVASSTFTLRQGQYQPVSFTGQLIDMGAHVKVVVELPVVHESIGYTVTRSNQ